VKLLVKRGKERRGRFPHIRLVAEVDGLAFAFALTVRRLFFGIGAVNARAGHE
jgi:hypothetical protein